MQNSLTEILAAHIADTPFEALPPAEVTASRLSLIETVGCALAAVDAPGMRGVLSALREEGGKPQATIWATGERATARQAAFANSAFAAALDYDSVFQEGIVHSDIIVVPIALALAEAGRCSGRDALLAIALGNDVLCRLSLATRLPRKGWFFSSVYGVLVAAGITARLLGGDAKAIAHAMGLASLNAGGTYQPMAERSMSKRLLAAFAVQAGMHCGQLAAAGIEGVRGGIDGAHGLFALYNEGDASKVTDGLGRVFLGGAIGRKPFPSCQCNHAPIEAVLALRREHGMMPAQVEDVQVLLSPHACRVVGAPYDPREASQTAAQFSAQYSVACALVRGKLDIEEIQPAVMDDPQVRQLVQRVRIVQDDANAGTYVPATVVVRLRDGSSFSRTVDANRGAPESPLSRAELLAKFRDCVAAAAPRLAADAVEDMFAALERIDAEPDAGRALERLTPVWLAN